MLSENDVVVDMDDIHDIFYVVLSQILKNFQLNTRLVVVLLLIFHNFDSYVLLLFVVKATNSCSKAALSQELADLIPVANMVTRDIL